MSVIKSNFTTRISNFLQKKQRELSEVTGRSLNDISEEVTTLGIRELLKKHPEYKQLIAGKRSS